MVLVLVESEVSQQILTLAEPVSQERLSQTAARLNRLLAGLAVDAISALPSRSDALDQDISASLFRICAALRAVSRVKSIPTA